MWQTGVGGGGGTVIQQGTSDEVLTSQCGANGGGSGKGSCWLSSDALPEMVCTGGPLVGLVEPEMRASMM